LDLGWQEDLLPSILLALGYKFKNLAEVSWLESVRTAQRGEAESPSASMSRKDRKSIASSWPCTSQQQSRCHLLKESRKELYKLMQTFSDMMSLGIAKPFMTQRMVMRETIGALTRREFNVRWT
jgi:hypothetical protein